MGHYATVCTEPGESQDAVNMMQMHTHDTSIEEDSISHFAFPQKGQKYNNIPSTWVMLDSCSTFSVFKNQNFVTNICPSSRVLNVLTNGGTHQSNKIADTRYFGQVGFNPDSMDNILALADVCKFARVTMDSEFKNSIFVHRQDGLIMEFKEFKPGLYFFDLTEQKNNTNTTSDINYTYLPSYSLFQTAEDNKSSFTKREVSDVAKVRVLMQKLGPPSQVDFEHYLWFNLIRDWPLTVHDARCTLHIWGPELHLLGGKTVKTRGRHVPTLIPIDLPENLVKSYKTTPYALEFLISTGMCFFTQ